MKTVDEIPKTLVFTETLPSEYVDCSSRLCYGGGVDLGELLRYMVGSGLRELETTKSCLGHHWAGRKRGDDCERQFKVAIQLTFR